MGRFKTLADAGHILRMDRSYPAPSHRVTTSRCAAC
jgi:hypothetical protein